MKPNRSKQNKTKQTQTKTKVNQTKPNQKKQKKTKLNPIKPRQTETKQNKSQINHTNIYLFTKPNQIYIYLPNQTKYISIYQTKPNQIKTNQTKPINSLSKQIKL